MNAQFPGHVLIVDDNLDTLEALRDTVASAGYRCTIARGGAAAYRAFERDQPDAVATDLNMAGGDGFVFMQRIREHSKVPIVVFSGYVTSYARARIERQFPGTPILTKPFSRVKFLETIERLIREGMNDLRTLSSDEMVA